MKPILEHLNTLPEPYRSEAIENYDHKHKMAQGITMALIMAFDFADSKQGLDYWQSVVSSL